MSTKTRRYPSKKRATNRTTGAKTKRITRVKVSKKKTTTKSNSKTLITPKKKYTSNVRSISSARKAKASKSINKANVSGGNFLYSIFNNVLVDIKKIPFNQFTKDRDGERQQLINQLKLKKQANNQAYTLTKDIARSVNSIANILQKPQVNKKSLKNQCAKIKTRVSKVSKVNSTFELRYFDLQTAAGIFGEVVLVLHGLCKNFAEYRKAFSHQKHIKIKQEIRALNKKIQSFLSSNYKYLPANVSSSLSTVTGLVQTVITGVNERKAS